jgi:hypothetical protein
LHFPEQRLQRRIFVPDGPSACESSGIISCRYPDWCGEARQPGFKLLIQKKRHSANRPGKISSAIIDNVAGNRNPRSTAIPAIIEFPAVCFAGGALKTCGKVEMSR